MISKPKPEYNGRTFDTALLDAALQYAARGCSSCRISDRPEWCLVVCDWRYGGCMRVESARPALA